MPVSRRYRRPGEADEVQNERVQMMDLAIRLVENFTHCHRGDIMESGDVPKAAKELSDGEKTCYRSALSFLQKEFGVGWRDKGESIKDGDMPDDPFEKSKEPAKK